MTVKALHRFGILQEDFLQYVAIGAPKSILAGPFEGMRYLPFSYGSRVFTKFIGTYELELQPAVESLDDKGIDMVVDIGSAEGYYAVGLTRRLKVAKTVAFDIIPYAHEIMMKNARLNSLERIIETRGACDADALQSLLATAKTPLVVSDCEGFEDEILDPEKVPGLLHATMLVETHDHDFPGITDRLMQRFGNSHAIEKIASTARSVEDLTIKLDVAPEALHEWMQEPRPDTQCYLFMTPKQ